MAPKGSSGSTACVWIRLAELAAGEELQADWRLVQCLSEVAADMPEPGEGQQRTWDLSHLLLSGEPVSRETCVDWLNLTYALIRATPYDAEAAASFSTRMSAVRLCRLLEFADAVASPRSLLASLPPLSNLFLPLQLGGKDLELTLDDGVCGGGEYYHSTVTPAAVGGLLRRSFASSGSKPVGRQDVTPADIAAFEQQAFAQLERLLFLAYKLDVAPLSHRPKLLQGQTAAAALPMPDGVLFSTKRDQLVDVVFSRRVQEAAGSNPNLRHLLVAGVLAAA